VSVDCAPEQHSYIIQQITPKNTHKLNRMNQPQHQLRHVHTPPNLTTKKPYNLGKKGFEFAWNLNMTEKSYCAHSHDWPARNYKKHLKQEAMLMELSKVSSLTARKKVTKKLSAMKACFGLNFVW
jgi:hypothetical protein